MRWWLILWGDFHNLGQFSSQQCLHICNDFLWVEAVVACYLLSSEITRKHFLSAQTWDTLRHTGTHYWDSLGLIGTHWDSLLLGHITQNTLGFTGTDYWDSLELGHTTWIYWDWDTLLGFTGTHYWATLSRDPPYILYRHEKTWNYWSWPLKRLWLKEVFFVWYFHFSKLCSFFFVFFF